MFVALINAYISFVGQLRTNVSAYFPWNQACVCMESRVIKILNVKVSLQCFVFILCFSQGGHRNTTGDNETNMRPEFIQHAGSISPKQPHARKRAHKMCMGMLERFCVCVCRFL